MIQNNHLFKKFILKSKTIIKFSRHINLYDQWITIDGFDMLEMRKGIWSKESLLKTINEAYPIKTCMIIRMSPNTSYNWHKDFYRGVTINMLIEHSNSHCLFGDVVDRFNDNITELNYEVGHFYLFNTQHRHCVINFEKPRYLFSTVFEQEKDDLSYQDVYNWCLSQGLIYE